jgi:predicted nuclease of predicted toxin-antitoxin system
MRFLLDMGISPRVAEFLREEQHDAVHLFEQGLGRLPDRDILTKARDEGRILLTHDLDFADLLAASGADLPSVILFRLSDMRPASVRLHLARVLTDFSLDLERGAIISVSDRRIRVRALPITAFPPRR